MWGTTWINYYRHHGRWGFLDLREVFDVVIRDGESTPFRILVWYGWVVVSDILMFDLYLG